MTGARIRRRLVLANRRRQCLDMLATPRVMNSVSNKRHWQRELAKVDRSISRFQDASAEF